MRSVIAALVMAAAIPAAANAQHDVTRRSFTFLEDRLVVAVQAEAPGELQVVRGQRGVIDVAAKSRNGFAGFGLGGDYTRQLSLTAVGSEEVQYLVVVPEHVSVSVTLPGGSSASVPRSGDVASYSWGDGTAATGPIGIAPGTPEGLIVVHSVPGRAPDLIDVPDLASVRSIELRVEGNDFRIAASRPLNVRPGDARHFEIRVDGDPLDLVLYIPRNTARFELRSGTQRVAAVTAGRPTGFCGGTIIQQPTADQDRLTVFPSGGRLNCR